MGTVGRKHKRIAPFPPRVIAISAKSLVVLNATVVVLNYLVFVLVKNVNF